MDIALEKRGMKQYRSMETYYYNMMLQKHTHTNTCLKDQGNRNNKPNTKIAQILAV